MKVPEGRKTIAHCFNGGLGMRSGVESRRDERTRVRLPRMFCRPSGACFRLPGPPTVETVGYSPSPRRGNARTPQEKTALERQIAATGTQIDRLVYDLYGLTEVEIKIVEGGAS